MAQSQIAELDLRPMRAVEILLVSASALRRLITAGPTNLSVVEVDNTPTRVLQVQSMPGLTRLSVQDSLIRHLELRQNTGLKHISLGFGQTCITRPGVVTFLGQIEVSSSPVRTHDDQLCTMRFHQSTVTSMGTGYEADVFGEMIDFRHNLIADRQRFNVLNLFASQYLSLRDSSFTDFDADALLSLEFIDIRGSNIDHFNGMKCRRLRQVVADSWQTVSVNDGVEVVEFTLPAEAPDNVHDTAD